jgi:hypothetical protein
MSLFGICEDRQVVALRARMRWLWSCCISFLQGAVSGFLGRFLFGDSMYEVDLGIQVRARGGIPPSSARPPLHAMSR